MALYELLQPDNPTHGLLQPNHPFQMSVNSQSVLRRMQTNMRDLSSSLQRCVTKPESTVTYVFTFKGEHGSVEYFGGIFDPYQTFTSDHEVQYHKDGVCRVYGRKTKPSKKVAAGGEYNPKPDFVLSYSFANLKKAADWDDSVLHFLNSNDLNRSNRAKYRHLGKVNSTPSLRNAILAVRGLFYGDAIGMHTIREDKTTNLLMSVSDLAHKAQKVDDQYRRAACAAAHYNSRVLAYGSFPDHQIYLFSAVLSCKFFNDEVAVGIALARIHNNKHSDQREVDFYEIWSGYTHSATDWSEF